MENLGWGNYPAKEHPNLTSLKVLLNLDLRFTFHSNHIFPQFSSPIAVFNLTFLFIVHNFGAILLSMGSFVVLLHFQCTYFRPNYFLFIDDFSLIDQVYKVGHPPLKSFHPSLTCGCARRKILKAREGKQK